MHSGTQKNIFHVLCNTRTHKAADRFIFEHLSQQTRDNNDKRLSILWLYVQRDLAFSYGCHSLDFQPEKRYNFNHRGFLRIHTRAILFWGSLVAKALCY
jgi:hypothetical protein